MSVIRERAFQFAEEEPSATIYALV